MNAPSSEPLYFGSGDRALFGWLHRPQHDREQRTGIVLCNPMGHEALSTHRSYRHLAEMAASAGIPALRFDYDGTGDSAGADTDSERLTAWTRSIAQAVATLRAACNVEQVCLFGIRLGATLAALASVELPEVHALIAVCPVVSGRRYLRELRALAATGLSPVTAASSSTNLEEAAGFVTTDGTRADLLQVDLGQLDRASLTAALILERENLQADEQFPAALDRIGVKVERQAFAGYAEMMLDSHDTVVPVAMLESALAWLLGLGPTSGQPARVAAEDFASTSIATIATEAGLIRESAVFLDGGRGLFAIVSEPAASASGLSPQKRSVLLLPNSGAVHHIGPNRLYVRIARALAAQGVAVIRMDIAGLGDSPPLPGEKENVVYTRGAAMDIERAVNFARTKLQAGEIHCAGICSGAYHSLKAAAAGIALRGITMVNPLTFFWKEGMSLAQPSDRDMGEAMRYQQSSRQWSSWLKLLSGRVNLAFVAAVFANRMRKKTRHTARDLGRKLGLKLKDDLAAELQLVADRGTSLDFIFAATDPGLPMLLEQGGAAVLKLQRLGKLQIEIIENADHTFTPSQTQTRLIELLRDRYAGTSRQEVL